MRDALGGGRLEGALGGDRAFGWHRGERDGAREERSLFSSAHLYRCGTICAAHTGRRQAEAEKEGAEKVGGEKTHGNDFRCVVCCISVVHRASDRHGY